MKHLSSYNLICLFSILTIAFNASSQVQNKLQVDMRLYMYETPAKKQYAELYTGVLSSSLRKSLTTGIQGVGVTIIVNKEDQITYADKYNLTKSIDSETDFYDIQRIPVSPGEYRFHTVIVDLADTSRTVSRVLKIKVEDVLDHITLSTVQLLGNVQTAETNSDERMIKNGLVMEPLKYNYLNTSYKSLRAYFEVYKTSDCLESNYILRYDIVREAEAGGDTVLTRYKRRDVGPVDAVLLQERNDSNWTSGKYNLSIAVLDYDKNVLARAGTEFVLSNPKKTIESQLTEESIDNSFVQTLTEEELTYSLKALAPKVNPQDVERLNNLIADGSDASKKSFLYRYWLFSNSIDPVGAYDGYMQVVKAIDQLFYDGLGHGFETDRGYIYLKYGQPDHITSIEDEPTAPPYQIWTYTEFPATRQNNVKFVFFNPNGTTYEVLHSNARGEINDPQWLVKLYSNSPEDAIGNTVDGTGVRDYWNRRAAEYFNDN